MSKRTAPYSFRPDPALAARLKKALAATGMRPQELIEQCVRQALPAVVGKCIKTRRVAEKVYLEEQGRVPNGSAG